MWGGWDGTQPVIPALRSLLTKREAGTAQPARTHMHTDIHTDTRRQSRARVNHRECPCCRPPRSCPSTPGQRVTHSLSVSKQQQETRFRRLLVERTHTHKYTHKRALKELGRSAKDGKTSGPVPSRGCRLCWRRQKGR